MKHGAEQTIIMISRIGLGAEFRSLVGALRGSGDQVVRMLMGEETDQQ